MANVWEARPGSILRTPALRVMDRQHSHTHESTMSDLRTYHSGIYPWWHDVCFSHVMFHGIDEDLGQATVGWMARKGWKGWNGEEFTRSRKRKHARYAGMKCHKKWLYHHLSSAASLQTKTPATTLCSPTAYLWQWTAWWRVKVAGMAATALSAALITVNWLGGSSDSGGKIEVVDSGGGSVSENSEEE